MALPAQRIAGELQDGRILGTAPQLIRPPRLRRAAVRSPQCGITELLVRLLRDIPSLVKLLYRLGRDPRVSGFDKLLLAGAATYLASPYDLIPDWIPLLGRLDDLLVVAAALQRLLRRAGLDLLLEHWEGDPYTLELLIESVGRIGLAVQDPARRPLRS
jgi:uncharacterized membrane protein YkvA (DUF1232 family)